MKKTLLTLILMALALSVGAAQDNVAVEETAAENPKAQLDAQTGAQDRSPLHELDWMVGAWVDQGDESTITTQCVWTHNGKFLSRSFRVNTGGEVMLEGTQLIGWHPIEGRIRSWTFDSEGGIGEGRWYQDGSRWLVKMSFTLATGEKASATNVITYVDENTLTWRSIGREIAGELQPSIPEVTVVRQQDTEPATDEPAAEKS